MATARVFTGIAAIGAADGDALRRVLHPHKNGRGSTSVLRRGLQRAAAATIHRDGTRSSGRHSSGAPNEL
jgi:hypothetical protein